MNAWRREIEGDANSKGLKTLTVVLFRSRREFVGVFSVDRRHVQKRFVLVFDSWLVLTNVEDVITYSSSVSFGPVLLQLHLQSVWGVAPPLAQRLLPVLIPTEPM